jgi:small-conductance mechanosensitive channel
MSAPSLSSASRLAEARRELDAISSAVRVADGSDGAIADASRAVDILLARPVLALLVVFGTWVAIRIVRGLLRRVVRRIADRAMRTPGRSSWRVRVQRVFGETAELAEKRRRQRIDAVSRMIGHLVSLVAWITAAVIVLHVMQVDLVPVLTSAGFIGAGLAIGGQHAVRDFLAGVSVLVEDRYGIGDRILVETAIGTQVDGIVEHVGAFSTRLSTDGSTFHVSNGSLVYVRNLSQQPVTTALEVPMPEHARLGDADASADVVAFALAQAAGDRQLTGMVLVDDVRATVGSSPSGRSEVQVQLRTAQPISDAQADVLQRLASDALWQEAGSRAGSSPPRSR